jgi:hypothetical protein
MRGRSGVTPDSEIAWKGSEKPIVIFDAISIRVTVRNAKHPTVLLPISIENTSSAMSIVKMPFTLAALVGFHITYTSPNSSAEGKPVAEGRIRVTHFLPIIKVRFECYRLLQKHLLNHISVLVLDDYSRGNCHHNRQ